MKLQEYAERWSAFRIVSEWNKESGWLVQLYSLTGHGIQGWGRGATLEEATSVVLDKLKLEEK